MRPYIIRRLLLIIPVMVMATVLGFLLVHLLPGDIIDAMQVVPDVQLDRAALEHALGLDAPIYVQYGRWLGVVPQMDGNFSGIFQGNLGTSFWQKVPVVKLVAQALPVSLELGLMGLIIGQLIAVPIGIISAIRQDKWGDYLGRSFALGCISFPNFWVATLIIIFPAIWWGYMPPIMLIHFTEDPINNLRMFILPALTLGMASCGYTMRLTRTQMLEVLRQDYVRTAWAKGLKERVVILRHVLKNALIPVVTMIGIMVPTIIGGVVIIENIFNLPGMGRLIINAVIHRDELLVCGIVLIFSVFLVLTNLIVDLIYGFLDPRVHYK